MRRDRVWIPVALGVLALIVVAFALLGPQVLSERVIEPAGGSSLPASVDYDSPNGPAAVWTQGARCLPAKACRRTRS